MISVWPEHKKILSPLRPNKNKMTVFSCCLVFCTFVYFEAPTTSAFRISWHSGADCCQCCDTQNLTRQNTTGLRWPYHGTPFSIKFSLGGRLALNKPEKKKNQTSKGIAQLYTNPRHSYVRITSSSGLNRKTMKTTTCFEATSIINPSLSNFKRNKRRCL